MNIWQIIGRLVPFVRPHKWLVVFSLVLTLIGAVAAQVNPLVLRYTVDSIQGLIDAGRTVEGAAPLLIFITVVLFVKELVNIAVKYGQSMLGERIRLGLHPHVLTSPV